MRKTDNAIREVLSGACDIAEEKYEGFQWLTHFVNYSDFPDPLAVVCVFDANAQLVKTDMDELRLLIKTKLASIDIHLRDISRHVSFDTEENCTKVNNGKWHERFNFGS